MDIKSLFDPIDRLINQAKGYIAEQDARKQFLQQIEEKIETIRPELERREQELIDLKDKIETDEDLRAKIEQSLLQLKDYFENIDLIAEKELSLDLLHDEKQHDGEDHKEARRKYIHLQLRRLEEQLKNTNNFFEAADFANEIWADFDLFEEFQCDETVVQILVDRMNETNTKNTETRMGKDLKKTLEHIRMNLVKSTAWTDDEVSAYKVERNMKLKQLHPVKIPADKTFRVAVLGADKALVKELYENYSLPRKLTIDWYDVIETENLKRLFQAHDFELVLLVTLSPSHQKFSVIRELLVERSIITANVLSFSTEKLIATLEDELIRISFQEQFS